MANRELTIDVSVENIDEMVSDLKRVQREAKKATQAIRELETMFTDVGDGKRYYTKWKQSHDDECTDIREICLSDIPTEYLARELSARKDRVTYVVDPRKDLIEFIINGKEVEIDKRAYITIIEAEVSSNETSDL